MGSCKDTTLNNILNATKVWNLDPCLINWQKSEWSLPLANQSYSLWSWFTTEISSPKYTFQPSVSFPSVFLLLWKCGLFFFTLLGKCIFSILPWLKNIWKILPPSLRKRGGESFTFWQRYRMEIFDSKEVFQNKVKYKKHVKTRRYNGNYFHSQL